MPVTSAMQANLQTSLRAQQGKLQLLSQKIGRLKASTSPDPIQQLQTEVIVELYDMVKTIQDQLSPLIGAIVPDVGAVRDAAGQTTVQSFTQRTLKPGKYF